MGGFRAYGSPTGSLCRDTSRHVEPRFFSDSTDERLKVKSQHAWNLHSVRRCFSVEIIIKDCQLARGAAEDPAKKTLASPLFCPSAMGIKADPGVSLQNPNPKAERFLLIIKHWNSFHHYVHFCCLCLFAILTFGKTFHHTAHAMLRRP